MSMPTIPGTRRKPGTGTIKRTRGENAIWHGYPSQRDGRWRKPVVSASTARECERKLDAWLAANAGKETA